MEEKNKYKIGNFVKLKDGNLYVIMEMKNKILRCKQYGKCPDPSIDNTWNIKNVHVDDIDDVMTTTKDQP